MEEKYKQFEDFNWSDERWQAYLSELYPPPNYKQVLKFKKKWYKKTIDSEFDVSYEPGASSAGDSNAAGGGGRPFTQSADGGAWASMGFKGVLCGITYLISLFLCLASIPGFVTKNMAIGFLTGSALNEVLMKHPIRFSKEFLEKVIQEDVTMMLFLALTVLLPGIQPAILTVALVPLAATAFLSLQMIFKHVPQMQSGPLKLISPSEAMLDINARYKLLQVRADSELMLGFIFIVGVFLKLNSFIHPLLFWNTMRMKYAMTPWTQQSFRKIDAVLSPILDKIPGGLYSKLKDALHNFADMEKQASSGCNIL